MTEATADHARLLQWVEQIAAYLVRDGVSPIAGRILGWLMVCDPPEQSAVQIAVAISASRASLTTNMQVLTTLGLVSRRARPGERTAYYRIDDDAWERLVQRQVDSLTAFCDLTSAGMDLVGSTTNRAARIRAAHATFAWMRDVFADAPSMPSNRRGGHSE